MKWLKSKFTGRKPGNNKWTSTSKPSSASRGEPATSQPELEKNHLGSEERTAAGLKTHNDQGETRDVEQDEADCDVEYKWGALWSTAYEKLKDKEPGLIESYKMGLLESGDEYKQKRSTGSEISRQE